MILAILPVMTGAIAQHWDRQPPRALWWLGCAIAFAGETLLLYDPAAVDGAASIEGDLLVWLILAEDLSLIFLLASSIIMVGVIIAFRAR